MRAASCPCPRRARAQVTPEQQPMSSASCPWPTGITAPGAASTHERASRAHGSFTPEYVFTPAASVAPHSVVASPRASIRRLARATSTRSEPSCWSNTGRHRVVLPASGGQFSLCARQGSNLHALRRWNLNPVRLPIPPLALRGGPRVWGSGRVVALGRENVSGFGGVGSAEGRWGEGLLG
jgi:hypothetical protein